MDVAGWVLLAALAIALATMALPRWRARASEAVRWRPSVSLQPVLTQLGPRRCLAAVSVLEALAARADSAAIVRAWSVLEGPLLEALPDCPPDVKPSLAQALAECARGCSHRATAQALMAMRNGLIGEVPR